jgi:hypothetical protein
MAYEASTSESTEQTDALVATAPDSQAHALQNMRDNRSRQRAPQSISEFN